MRHRNKANAGVVGQRSAGVAFLLVPALLIWLSIAVYNKQFTNVTWVTVKTPTTGNEMHPHADVKLRGVVVGEVRSISTDGSTATLKLAMQPDKMKMIPGDVTAQMLPTTLFGQRYVALVPPAQPSPARLTANTVIDQDRSSNAIELQKVLNNLMPMLTAVQPEKLSATLTAVSQALDGRGTDLGKTLVELDAYLKKFNPSLPELNKSITELVGFTQTYSEATPDILAALDDLTSTSRTIVNQEKSLAVLYSSLTAGSRNLTDFLRENSGNLIRASTQSRASLETLARYAPELPCTLGMMNDFIPLMDKVLGKGTSEPGLHVNVVSVPSKGAYTPGKDRPRFGGHDGPHCYSVPYGNAPRASVASAGAVTAGAPGGLGLPNSPEENRLVNELMAPGLQETPETLPDWSTVLTGPLYRGTEVKIG
ncbi:mce related protein [Actinomadura rubteroloni]|uniref:Mce related protein n=1 Tax=Actinomadura rubteroloni TaxID=1926885 RepID=A0A2P4UQR5_9ACTN|nr:MCE family protein [Actinomadura rubteroloni]POM27386.1 mce related protein [Actinomadura rubteroloni]